jgi:CheY-like chemotaxis protein
MSAPKVMIFESDRGFADALKRAFSRRGCAVRVVDDGQIGLDLAPTDPPDLIIVAVELPRMSGFAVCNKLKKVPELKDIPVVIISSESSQETFDHHSKLRTRAEDYVHKPISVDDLIQRCAAHVQVPDAPASDAEEVSIDDLEAVAINDEPTFEAEPLPDPLPEPARADAELEHIAEAAFDQIMLPSNVPGQAAPTPVKVATPLPAPPGSRFPSLVDDDLDDLTMVGSSRSLADVQLAMRAGARVSQPTPPRTPTPGLAPPAQAPVPHVSSAELDALRTRAEEAEAALLAARNEAARVALLETELASLRGASAEVQQLTRELQDLRARATKTAPPGAREGLELRESLHKKDKEILHLRELANTRDKDVLQLRETLLQRDLEKADLDERMLEREREIADLTDRSNAQATEIEGLNSRLADTTRTLADERTSHADTRKRATDADAALRAELASEREARAHEVSALNAAHTAATSVAKAAHDDEVAALRAEMAAAQRIHADATAAHEKATTDAAAAHAAAVAALRDEMAAAARAHDDATAAAKTAHEKATADATAAHEKATADATAAHEKATADATAAHEAAVAALRDEMANAAAEHARAAAEHRAAEEKALADARDAHATEVAALAASHAAALADARDAHAAEVAALAASHAAALAAARDELAAERSARADEVRGLVDAHTRAIAEADAATQTLKADLEARLRDLDGRLTTTTSERDAAIARGDQLADNLATSRAEVTHATRLATRNAALLDRARRAVHIAAGLVDATTAPLEAEAATTLGNAE